ncbi:MAG: hypothetical protein IJ496_10430 [Ruminococcus sp.]|nr:hypothetical protein [Ruminococcus sp.]
MKKITALILASMTLLTLSACGGKETETSDISGSTAQETTEAAAETEDSSEEESAVADTVGQTLLQDFLSRAEEDPELSAQELADALLANDIIAFSGAAMPVEEGLLTGFGNAEITGFQEGAMFAPMIGTIPFVGYIFVLEEGSDTASFMAVLEENADPRWNICTEADETIVESSGRTVFFLMCPSVFEDVPAE